MRRGGAGGRRADPQRLARTVLLLPLALLPGCSEPLECEQRDPDSLYKTRIEPILTDDRATSCNECHLSSIDLRLYKRGGPCQTMACMVRKGLVDLDDPDRSLVLDWIARADSEVADAEYDAFREWIGLVGSCGDDACDISIYDKPCATPEVQTECELLGVEITDTFVDPGDCSDQTLELVFLNRIYAWRGRCFPCHWTEAEHRSPTDAHAPRFFEVGDCELASLESLRMIQDAGYIDTADPESSLLVLKPLSPNLGGLEHDGHNKFGSLTNDDAYLDFVDFLRRYAACQG